MDKLSVKEKHNLKRKLIHDSSVMYFSTLANMGSRFLLIIVLGRTIGPESFGLLQLAITAVSFIALFLDLKTDDAIIKFLSEYVTIKDSSNAKIIVVLAYSINILQGLVTLLILFLLSPFIAKYFLHQPETAYLIKIYTVGIIATYFGRTSSSIIQSLKKFKLVSSMSIVASISRFAIPCALIKFGLEWIMYGYAIAMIFYAVMSTTFAIINIKPHIKNNPSFMEYMHELKNIAFFIFHGTISSSFKSFIVYIDVLILGYFRGPEEVAYYKFALAFTSVFGFISSPVNAVAYPNLNTIWIRGDYSTFKKIILKITKYKTLVLVPIAALAAFFSPLIIRFTVTEKFLPAKWAIYIVIGAVIITNIFSWMKSVLLIWKKPQMSSLGNFVILCLMIGFSFILVPKWGFIGSAVTYFLSYNIGILFFLVIIYNVGRKKFSRSKDL